MTWICDYCETENLNDIKVCPKCKTWLCDNCNAQNFPRYRYCVECGVNRKKEEKIKT